MASKRRKAKAYAGEGAVSWWRAKDPGESLAGCVEKLLELDLPRQERCEKLYRLYGGSRLIGIRPWEQPSDLKPYERDQRDALRLNVCKAAVDTITAKVGRLRPRPTFLTQGGNFKLQQRAKKLQVFMDGAYHQSDTYEISPDVFRDAMIFGTGVFHPLSAGKRITNERVPCWEFTVDPRDGLYGKPRRLYRVKWVSRECVAEAWGDDVLAEVGEAPAGTNDAKDDETGQEGYVRVVEAWQLPAPDYEYDEAHEDMACDMAVKEGCGRHTLQVGEKVIEDTLWTAPEFPFVFVHWCKPAQGFWGESAISEVVGIQVEVNKLLQSVQEAMQKVGQPWVFQKDGAVLSPGQVINGIGQVYKVASDFGGSLEEALRVVTFQPVNPQVIQHIWSLYEKAFEILGSNQLAASATAPAGMESARGLERLSDEQSERFMTVSHHFEYCVGEALARQFIRVAKELDDTLDGGFSIRAPGDRRTSKDIKWSEVELDEDGYLIQVFPTSVLPTQPSARIDEVQRLADSQWIDKEEARKLINLPDLEASDDLATADLDNLTRQLGVMLEDGKQVMPEPYQNLNRALQMAQQSVLRAQADGVPERHVDMVRNFITGCETLLKRAAPPAPPPGAPPAGNQPPPPPGA